MELLIKGLIKTKLEVSTISFLLAADCHSLCYSSESLTPQEQLLWRSVNGRGGFQSTDRIFSPDATLNNVPDLYTGEEDKKYRILGI